MREFSTSSTVIGVLKVARGFLAAHSRCTTETIASCSRLRPCLNLSINDLFGTSDQHRRHLDADCLGGLQIDYEEQLIGLLHGQVCRFCAAQDLVDVCGCPAKLSLRIDTVRDKPTFDSLDPVVVHRGQLFLPRQLNNRL